MTTIHAAYDVAALQQQLDERGFFTIENFLARDEIEAAHQETTQAITGVESLPNPQERDFFEVFSLHPKTKINLDRPMLNAIDRKPELLSIVRGLLGEDCHALGKLFQAYMPHAGHRQSWHTDSDPDDLPFQLLTCLIYFQDQTPELGYTRFAPGTHRTKITRRFDSHADLPRQVSQIVPAGTLCCFVSTVWHSATENRSNQPRLVYGLRFCRKEFAPNLCPGPYGRARHARGFRRFGKPIFDHPTDSGSYPWPEAWQMPT
jgi:ectoine hydroxylase-related dioxygenase (phytanoyl-CoA dioxygenase family)